MFKKNLLMLSVCASLFIGCGGGGGSSTPTVEKYDAYNYLFNPIVLSEDKIAIKNIAYKKYEDGIQTINNKSAYVNIKNSDNKIDEYYLYNQAILTIEQYNQLISTEIASGQYVVISEEIKYTDYDDNSIDTYKRNLVIGDKIFTETQSDGSIWTCNLNKHYDIISVKDTINSFFGKEYSNSSKTYSDVIEETCTSSVTDEVHNAYFAKNIGFIFYVNKETLSSGVKEESFQIVDSHVLLTK